MFRKIKNYKKLFFKTTVNRLRTTDLGYKSKSPWCLGVLVTFFWAFATRRAFRYIFAPLRFAKDAASIPTATGYEQ